MLKKLTAVFLIACMVVTLHAPFSFAAEVGSDVGTAVRSEESTVETSGDTESSLTSEQKKVNAGTEENAAAKESSVTEESQNKEDKETEEETSTTEDGFDPKSVTCVSEVAPLVKDETTPTAVKASPFRMMSRVMALADEEPTVEESTEENKGLIRNKETTGPDDDGNYNIKLETYVTGEVKTSTVTTPADIVLVLDTSGSMKDPLEYTEIYAQQLDKSKTYYIYVDGGYQEIKWKWNWNAWYYNWEEYTPKTSPTDTVNTQFYTAGITKMDSLKAAVNNFITQVAASAAGPDGNIATTEDNIDHRIAIVKFAGQKKDEEGDDTYQKEGYTYNYSQIVKKLTTVSDNTDLLQDTINKLTAAGATPADYGMEHAQTILNGIDSNRSSSKVVVMFTDGEPNYFSGFNNEVACNTINTSKNIKDAGATVYTIGMFSGANDSRIPTGETETFNNENTRTNKYMHFVSSNYKNATAASNSSGSWIVTPGTATYPEDASKSYYLAADSADKLNEIFSDISENIQSGSASIKLGADTVIKDVISDYFVLPEGADKTSISVTTEDAVYQDGDLSWSNSKAFEGANVEINDKTVSVSGFDFNTNYVAETGRVEGDASQSGNFHGRKLVINFSVKADPSFLGGNNVPTNGEISGIYKPETEEPVGLFDVPDVNVPVKEINPEISDQKIYLTQSADLEQNLITNLDDYIGGIKNDYASVTYTIKEGDNLIGTYVVNKGKDQGTWSWDQGFSAKLTEDKNYTVTVDVNGGTGNTSSKEGTATVKVYKPVVTFGDGTEYYEAVVIPENSTVDSYLDGFRLSTDWKNGSDPADPTEMGSAPQLEFRYMTTENSIKGGKISTKKTISVDVAGVKVGTEQLTEGYIAQHFTFVHNDCTENESIPKGAEFLIHVNTCSLTINKTGGTKGEPYVFHIKKDRDDYTSVSIIAGENGGGTVTIGELPIGTYTVSEDESWSWYYTPEFDQENATLDSKNPTGTICCTNKKKDNHWFNGFSDVVTNIFGQEPATTPGN